jgi:hypothetical protein
LGGLAPLPPPPPPPPKLLFGRPWAASQGLKLQDFLTLKKLYETGD